MSTSRGTVSAISDWRNTLSAGRIRPLIVAMTNTCHGCNTSRAARINRESAEAPAPIRMNASNDFRLIRSASTPTIGASSVPDILRAASIPTRNGESVATRMYHPRIRVSISDPQVVIASAVHWNRKLRILNAAKGLIFARGSRGTLRGFPEVATAASWDSGDPEGPGKEDFWACVSDVRLSEVPGPSATIWL